MSRLVIGLSAVLAVSVISGSALEIARGRDLSAVTGNGPLPAQASSLAITPDGFSSVNRTSKTDRTMGPSGSPGSMQTVSLKFEGFSDTTFLIRVPVAIATPPAALSTPMSRKMMTACEPMVSPLTEVAKQLQPGRCVT